MLLEFSLMGYVKMSMCRLHLLGCKWGNTHSTCKNTALSSKHMSNFVHSHSKHPHMCPRSTNMTPIYVQCSWSLKMSPSMSRVTQKDHPVHSKHKLFNDNIQIYNFVKFSFWDTLSLRYSMSGADIKDNKIPIKCLCSILNVAPVKTSLSNMNLSYNES